jgi:hypothetical protein
MSSSHSPPRSDQRNVLETHAKGSPVLAAWLAQSETIGALDRFDAAEDKAARRQKRYIATARRATIFSTVGAVMAAVVLLPLERLLGHQPPSWLGLVQLLFVAMAFVSIWRIGLRKLLKRWMVARADAEERRADLFRALMRADLPAISDADAPLVAKLKAFEACHLAYQRGYYARRSTQLARASSNVAPMKLVGYVMITLSAAVSAIVGLDIIRGMGFGLPPWLVAVADIHVPDPARMQLGLGALASAALSFASAWTLINQDESNAARYAHTLGRLDALAAKERAGAEAAAREGRAPEVIAFTDRVQAIFDAEHGVWVTARPPAHPAAGPGPALRDAIGQ